MSDLLKTTDAEENFLNSLSNVVNLNLNNNNNNIDEMHKNEINSESNDNQTINFKAIQSNDLTLNSNLNNATLNNNCSNQNFDSNQNINIINEDKNNNNINNNNINNESDDVVQTHVSMIKDENGFVYYRCRFCGLTFNFMTTLKAHERVHNVIQPYLCNKCGESFHFMCELEYHLKSHLKQKGYKCDCGRTFFQYTEMLYHRHPNEDEQSNVPILETTPKFIKQSTYDLHEFPVPEFKEKGFEPKHSLKVYSEVRLKPYICQYCSKSYADSRGLAYHMYSHRGEKIFNPRASRYLMCRNENSYISL